MDPKHNCWVRAIPINRPISSYLYSERPSGSPIVRASNKYKLIMGGGVWYGLFRCCLLRCSKDILIWTIQSKISTTSFDTLVNKVMGSYLYRLCVTRGRSTRGGPVLWKYLHISKILWKCTLRTLLFILKYIPLESPTRIRMKWFCLNTRLSLACQTESVLTPFLKKCIITTLSWWSIRTGWGLLAGFMGKLFISWEVMRIKLSS